MHSTKKDKISLKIQYINPSALGVIRDGERGS